MKNYLKFTDEETAIACCPEWRSGNDWIQPTIKTEIAVRGTLYNNDATYDEEGNIVNQPTLKDGFFIDLIRGAVPSTAQKYLVNPITPDFKLA